MKKIKTIINKVGASKLLIFAVLIIIQFFLYSVIYNFLISKITLILGSITVLTVLVLLYILNDKVNPSYKMSWIIIILAFPGLGSFFYIFVKLDSLYKSLKKHYLKVKQDVCRLLMERDSALMKVIKEDELVYGIAHYTQEYGNYPIYDNTSSLYLRTGEEYFSKLLEEIKKAKKFIFMEFFIINNDYMWQSILNELISKVKEGIEVRVIYDGFGSLLTLPDKYREFLERNGIKTLVFSKVYPFLAIHQNNRDHRKIVVIDGQTCFTGGINLADEYINRKKRFGYWKDTGIMLKGEAVNSFTMMFFELWNISGGKEKDYSKYLSNKRVSSDGFVMPYSDSPLDKYSLSEDIYIQILNTATKYVYITTPYLILDDYLFKALDNAVKRGVDVRIIVPHIPDKKYVYYLAAATYSSLLEIGVKIYEYTPGFIHAKMFLSDDKLGVVGTINLDYRSLYLHFECAALLYKTSSLKDIKKDFEDMFSESILVDNTFIKSIPLYKKLFGKILKLFAPLM